MLGKLRPALGPLRIFVASPFARMNFSPFLFTLFGLLFALIAGFFIVQKEFFFGFLFAVIAVSVDLFDGEVARLQKKESAFGNYFETMVDKAVELILFFSAAFHYPFAAAFAVGFSMLASYAKPRAALVVIADNRDWPGIGEHAERMLLLLGGILLSAFSIEFFSYLPLELALWLIALVTLIGSIQRVLFAKKLIEEAAKEGRVLPYIKSRK